MGHIQNGCVLEFIELQGDPCPSWVLFLSNGSTTWSCLVSVNIEYVFVINMIIMIRRDFRLEMYSMFRERNSLIMNGHSQVLIYSAENNIFLID